MPPGCRADRGWRCIQVSGPLALTTVGVLADLSAVLASAGVSIFALSTYDTDYVLVRETDLGSAMGALVAHGHAVRRADGTDPPEPGRGIV
jgi:hypothetical protein